MVRLLLCVVVVCVVLGVLLDCCVCHRTVHNYLVIQISNERDFQGREGGREREREEGREREAKRGRVSEEERERDEYLIHFVKKKEDSTQLLYLP